MSKKTLPISLLLLTCAVYLWAADFWDSKPFTEWNDKEIQKILNDSPWADRLNVRTGQKGVIASDPNDPKATITGELEVPVTLRWRSALPVKQAVARLSPGGITPEAQALMDRVEQNYILELGGLPGSARAAAQDQDRMQTETSLKVKNKPDIKPQQIQVPQAAAPAGKGGPGGPGGGKGFGSGGFGNFDMYVVFPREALTEADKEVEFVTKVGNLTIRKKFKIADMMYNGKFEM